MNPYICLYCHTSQQFEADTDWVLCICGQKMWRRRCACGEYKTAKTCSRCGY